MLEWMQTVGGVFLGVMVGSLVYDLLLRRPKTVACDKCGVILRRDRALPVIIDHGPTVTPTKMHYCDRHGEEWASLRRDPGRRSDGAIVIGWQELSKLKQLEYPGLQPRRPWPDPPPGVKPPRPEMPPNESRRAGRPPRIPKGTI